LVETGLREVVLAELDRVDNEVAMLDRTDDADVEVAAVVATEMISEAPELERLLTVEDDGIPLERRSELVKLRAVVSETGPVAGAEEPAEP
jgi:hypothetical protein